MNKIYRTTLLFLSPIFPVFIFITSKSNLLLSVKFAEMWRKKIRKKRRFCDSTNKHCCKKRFSFFFFFLAKNVTYDRFRLSRGKTSFYEPKP